MPPYHCSPGLGDGNIIAFFKLIIHILQEKGDIEIRPFSCDWNHYLRMVPIPDHTLEGVERVPSYYGDITLTTNRVRIARN